MPQTVLLVDDEKNILSALRRLLLPDGYEVLSAENGAQGLDLARMHQPSVILSDMKMPGMDGIQFLQATLPVCPDAIRMVLSGYSEIEEILKAINEGHVWRYITKPWDEHDLRQAIRTAFAFRERGLETKRLLEEVERQNRALAALNGSLEAKVQQRTLELTRRSDLLNQVLEGTPLPSILAQACAHVRELTASDGVFLRTPLLPELTCAGAGSPPASENAQSLEAMDRRVPVAGEDLVSLPLLGGGQVLGSLSISKAGGAVQSLEADLGGYLSVVAVALSLQHRVVNAPALLGNIDSLLTGLA